MIAQPLGRSERPNPSPVDTACRSPLAVGVSAHARGVSDTPSLRPDLRPSGYSICRSPLWGRPAFALGDTLGDTEGCLPPSATPALTAISAMPHRASKRPGYPAATPRVRALAGYAIELSVTRRGSEIGRRLGAEVRLEISSGAVR